MFALVVSKFHENRVNDPFLCLPQWVLGRFGYSFSFIGVKFQRLNCLRERKYLMWIPVTLC